MKKLFLALCVPLSAFAQTEKMPKPKQNNWEVGVNFSGAILPQDTYNHVLGVGGMNILSCYRNFGNIQVGAAFEYSLISIIDGNDIVQFTPYVLLNRTFDLKRYTLYAGGMLGYTQVNVTNGFGDDNTSGFTTGLQAGGILWLAKDFGVNLETGVRSEQLWTTFSTDHGFAYRDNYFHMYFPVSAGIRFSF